MLFLFYTIYLEYLETIITDEDQSHQHQLTIMPHQTDDSLSEIKY